MIVHWIGLKHWCFVTKRMVKEKEEEDWEAERCENFACSPWQSVLASNRLKKKCNRLRSRLSACVKDDSINF